MYEGWSMARLSRRQFRTYQSILAGQLSPSIDFCYGWMPGPKSVAYGAYVFAKEFGGKEGVDIKRLQNMVIKACDPYTAYQYARNIPDANIRRLQDVVIRYGNPKLMRVFAENIPMANKGKLEAFAIIREVMEL